LRGANLEAAPFVIKAALHCCPGSRLGELVGVPRTFGVLLGHLLSPLRGKDDPDDDRGAHGEDSVPRCLYEPKLPVSRHPVNMRC
jgi:hypothetical protein